MNAEGGTNGIALRLKFISLCFTVYVLTVLLLTFGCWSYLN